MSEQVKMFQCSRLISVPTNKVAADAKQAPFHFCEKLVFNSQTRWLIGKHIFGSANEGIIHCPLNSRVYLWFCFTSYNLTMCFFVWTSPKWFHKSGGTARNSGATGSKGVVGDPLGSWHDPGLLGALGRAS